MMMPMVLRRVKIMVIIMERMMMLMKRMMMLMKMMMMLMKRKSRKMMLGPPALVSLAPASARGGISASLTSSLTD